MQYTISARLLIFIVFPLSLFLSAGVSSANESKKESKLIVVAAKSFAETGVLQHLVKIFKEKNPGINIEIQHAGSVKALEQVRNEQADIVISHYPEEEKRLLQQGFASRVTQLVNSQYAVFGPRGEKQIFTDKSTIFEVLKTLAEREVAFVVPSQRGGTYRKIAELWALAGINPNWIDYEYTQLSAIGALRQAAEFQSFTIADMGMYLVNKDKIPDTIVPVYQGGLELRNTYSVLLVNKKDKNTYLFEYANRFYDYLISEKGQQDLKQVNKDLTSSATLSPAAHLDPSLQTIKERKKLEQDKTKLIYFILILAFIVLILLFNIVLYRRMQQAEKKHAEGASRYQALVETTPDWVWETDFDNKISYSNPRINDILGYTEQEVTGSLVTSLVEIADRKKISKILSKKKAFYNLECPRRHKDQHLVTTEVSAVPIVDEQGDFKGYRGIERDISMRKITEKENLRLQREIQQSHKMESIGQLTGGIAHDFNNILGAILGYTQLANKNQVIENDEKLSEYLSQIKKAGFRAKELVAQMLAFSRGDNSKDHPIQFKPVIVEALSMLTSTLPSSIQIDTVLNDNVPDVLLTKTKLQQILLNLAINARDAMEQQGNIIIKLAFEENVNAVCTVSHKTITGDWVVLSVSDDGTGIAKENIQHIFNPFFTTKEVGKGTGLGLSVVYGIVHNHGGYLRLETEIDKGSAFKLYFPPNFEVPSEVSEVSMANDDAPMGQGQHVLVVDDDIIMAEYLEELLKIYEYHVSVVYSGEEALELILKSGDKFDLLVTDQTMPGMTGLELIKQVKLCQPELPIILCSGFSEQVDNNKDELDVCYFSKPIKTDDFLCNVASLVNNSSVYLN